MTLVPQGWPGTIWPQLGMGGGMWLGFFGKNRGKHVVTQHLYSAGVARDHMAPTSYVPKGIQQLMVAVGGLCISVRGVWHAEKLVNILFKWCLVSHVGFLRRCLGFFPSRFLCGDAFVASSHQVGRACVVPKGMSGWLGPVSNVGRRRRPAIPRLSQT